MKDNLTLKEFEFIAHRMAKETMRWNEPIPEFSTRYPNVLESCLAVPFQKFARRNLYEGLESKAAILFYLMIKNHPFQNGNKRIAVTTLLLFLYKNKKWLDVSNETLYRFSILVAQSPAEIKSEIVTLVENFLNKYIKNLSDMH
jgi:death on curing protein